MYAAHMYNARPSLTLDPVPETGYQVRLDALELNRQYMFPFGFQKTDEFYLKTSCDVVTYVYEHESEPVYFCNYHLGQFTSADLVTYFENDVTLTTCTKLSGGTAPRPPQSLLQIFENRPLDEVFYYHQKAVEFIQQRGGLRTRYLSVPFRERFIQSLQEFYKNTRNIIWPLKFFYWHLRGRSKMYAKPIQEQYLAGMIKIF